MSPSDFRTALAAAPIGAILVSYGDGPRPKGLAGLALKIAYNGIRRHQRALFKNSDKTDGVHIQIKVSAPPAVVGLQTRNGEDVGRWVSATVPTVELTSDPAPRSFARKYRIYRYTKDLPPEAQQELVDYACSMVGKDYDTLQLIGIAAHEQKWIPKFLRKWLGFRLQKPGMLEVCSTLAIKALLEAWARLILDDGLSKAPMPLEDINRDSFDVCPADFEHSVTMKLLAEINV